MPHQPFPSCVTSVFYFAPSAYQWCGWDTTQAHHSGTEPCAINYGVNTGWKCQGPGAGATFLFFLQPGIEPPQRATSAGVTGKSIYFPEANSGAFDSTLSFKN